MTDERKGKGNVKDGDTAASLNVSPYTGAADCPEQTHIHGCFADTGNCDEPEQHASGASRCPERVDLWPHMGVECDRFADHEGQHEALAFDFAWGPQEPTGKWVGDKWVRHAD